MQLLIKRAQRKVGWNSNTSTFQAVIRAQYTDEERSQINGSNLGGTVLYSSAAAQQHLANIEQQGLLRGIGSVLLARMNLNITIASLQKGHSIECQDLGELLDCEQAVIDACKNLKHYLAAAATFDGREIVVNVDED